MNYVVSVPLELASAKEIRRLLEKSLNLDLKPSRSSNSGKLREVSFYAPPTLAAQIEAYPSSLSRSELIQGLVSAIADRSDSQDDEQSLMAEDSSGRGKWHQGKAQKEMVDIIRKAIREKRVLFLEGSTGIGKSRVLAQAALQLSSSVRIGVFAPTLAVLYQLFEEFLATAKTLKITPGAIVIYIGRRNFVDLTKLDEILPTLEARLPEAAARAKKWVKQGGPAVTETTRLLKRHTAVQWLVEDLLEIVPEISASSVGCDEFSKPGPGLDAYQEAKKDIEDAQIIFSTHTMLCLAALNIRGKRPSPFSGFGAVFVDEAHLLEEAMANCTGSDLSLRHLHVSLREGYTRKDVSPNRWKAIEDLITRSQQQLDKLPPDYLVPARTEGNPPYQTFREHASALAKHLKEIQNSEDSLWLTRVKSWQFTLEQIASYNFEARVTFSPKLRLPSITVGPSYLRNYFATLWDNCESACLLSATLYVSERPGEFSSRFMRIKLGIPSERALDAKPFIAPWIYNTPTLYLPDPDHAQAYAYPGESVDAPAQLENWWITIARSISILAKDAAGGTLVLCNSYTDAGALGSRLDSLKRRLIVQSRDDSVKALTALFKAKARDGKRPVWLATGAAWTGLNLRDELAQKAADDRILTDLVITRTPMGRNRTASHMARVSNLGFDQELLDAAFTLRQGLGRLIRRDGLRDRRIWFLDGRIHIRRSTYHKINVLLRSYPLRGGKHGATTAS